MKLSILIASLGLLFFSACGGGGLTGIAERSLYPYEQANKTPVPDTPHDGYEQEFLEIELPAENGDPKENLSVHVWYYTNPNPSVPVLVYHHGNGMNLGSLSSSNLAEVFKGVGVHFVIYDYPSWGKSKGKPSQRTLTAAGLAVQEFALNQFNKKNVINWGRSLGAAVASQVSAAAESSTSKLILTSGWDKFINVAKHHTSLAKNLPKEWLEKHGWDSAKALVQFSKPVLQLHGNIDNLVPYKFGVNLHESIGSGDKKFVEVQDKGHNDIFQPNEFWQEVLRMINR